MKFKYLNKTQIKLIVNNYSKLGQKETAELVKADIRVVAYVATTLKLKVAYNSNVDVNVFKNCDTPEAAYVLGILWADGSLYQNSIRIECVLDDVKVFRKWFDKIGQWGFYTRNPPNRREQGSLYASSKKLGEFLTENDYHIKSQVAPTKILSIIPEELKKYFFIGFIDGDGCFYFNKKYGARHFVVSGTYEQDWVEMENFCKQLNINYEIKKLEAKNGNRSSMIRVTNRNNIRKIGEYIYDTFEKDNIGLPRKFLKYQEIIFQPSVSKR